jgi:molybdenum cofactor cytidylyltransferase
MISAIVLAAGKATRFGRCKQLVLVDGKALLDRVLDNLRASKIDDIVVVLGAHAEEIGRQISLDGTRVVMNPDYAEGMSTSIQAGLRALPERAEAAMIVLGDQPFVTPRTLDLLLDEYSHVRPKAIVPTYNDVRGNPVIVSRALFGEMMTIRGDVGCRAIFGGHDVMTLPVDDRGVTMDIDTMEDLPCPTRPST